MSLLVEAHEKGNRKTNRAHKPITIPLDPILIHEPARNHDFHFINSPVSLNLNRVAQHAVRYIIALFPSLCPCLDRGVAVALQPADIEECVWAEYGAQIGPFTGITVERPAFADLTDAEPIESGGIAGVVDQAIGCDWGFRG